MTSESKHIVLGAKKLTIGYFRKKQADVVSSNINFLLAEGELVALVGTNGIGKSTLLRTISGMQPIMKGAVHLKEKDLNSYTALQLAHYLSVVLTETPASKNLTVLELVSLGRQPYTNWMGKLSQEDKKIVTIALESTNTSGLSNNKCFELSDGQLQRVYIARALAQDTPIIILDEPTTHLDLYHRASILKLLKNLASETKKTILFSTHEIDLAIQLSDKMLVMTPEATYFDTPTDLIKAGRFDALFPKEMIHFDPETGRFTIKN
ncbi:MAG: iron complex transport system ATP-binding protein [Flavobacteriaceae bacterium]|jgi:iron complex transport system ATP-binding protein